MTQDIVFRPIGVIRSPFRHPRDTPVQPAAARGARGRVELLPEFVRGLRDLDGFSHIILIYYFHLSRGASMLVQPFLDEEPRGLFATRAPSRPNHIGSSVVRLTEVRSSVLQGVNVEVVDGTPLLDVKPYAPQLDDASQVRIGWMEAQIQRLSNARADRQFERSTADGQQPNRQSDPERKR